MPGKNKSEYNKKILKDLNGTKKDPAQFRAGSYINMISLIDQGSFDSLTPS